MSLDLVQGDFIVIRYEGPKGGPGMREMLTPTCLDCKEHGIGQQQAISATSAKSGSESAAA